MLPMCRVYCAAKRLIGQEQVRWMVQLGGFEPPTSGSTDRRSNHLSYSCTRPAWRGGRKLGATPFLGKGFPLLASGQGAAQTKGRATGPGYSRNYPCDALRDLLHRLGDAALDRLGCVGRNLLRNAGELLALR